MPGFDLKQINRNDQGILGAGIAAFIFSFLPWYQASYNGGVAGIFHESYSRNYSAWQGFGILGVLLLLAAVAITAIRVFSIAQLPKAPLGWNVIVAGAAGLGTLFVLFEWLIFDPLNGVHGKGISEGLAWAGYIFLILAIAETVFAFLNFKASGEKVAWDSSAMPRPAATGTPGAPLASYGTPVAPNAAPYGAPPVDSSFGAPQAAPTQAPASNPVPDSAPGFPPPNDPSNAAG